MPLKPMRSCNRFETSFWCAFTNGPGRTCCGNLARDSRSSAASLFRHCQTVAPLLRRRWHNNRYANRNLRRSLDSSSYFSSCHFFKRESQFYEMLPEVVYERNSFVAVRYTVQRHLRFGKAIRALGNGYVVHGFMETVVYFEP